MVLRCLLTSAACAAVVSRGVLDDAVGLLQTSQGADGGTPEERTAEEGTPDKRTTAEGTPEDRVIANYNTLADSRKAGKADAAAHVAAYQSVQDAIGRVETLSHSAHIMSYVTDLEGSPDLHGGGCLYMPSDEAWAQFYRLVEHPYPPLFAELIAHSYFPNCSKKALSGEKRRTECPNGHVMGHDSCVKVNHAGVGHVKGLEVQVFETDRHVGLPSKWKNHINTLWGSWGRGLIMQPLDNLTHRTAQDQADTPTTMKDKCSKSWKLPEVPATKMLVVPTQFVVCTAVPFHKGITRDMLKDQARWMTSAYRGRSTYTKMDFDHEELPQVDMQIEFNLRREDCTPTAGDDCYRIEFVRDEMCAKHAFSKKETAARHNKDPHGLFTIVFVGDDQSGVLGMAEFPQLVMEGNKDLVVRVSILGLRTFSSKNTELHMDTHYDEGDTAVHEAGHALGLYHTFEGGCNLDGDQVKDTHPEALPNFDCSQKNSCGNSDPVHNFMDYSPDTCMSGFTEIQKRRVWCVFENYRPHLFHKSLKVEEDNAASVSEPAAAAASEESVGAPAVTVDEPDVSPSEGGATEVHVHVHIHKD